MDQASAAHIIFRVLEVLTLIPCWAILAALISVYNKNGVAPPSGIVCLFIVALLASIWSFCVLITAMRARNTALWMTIFDIGFFAALIAGVVLLSNIASVQCVMAPVTGAIITSDGEKIWPSGVNFNDWNTRVWSNNHNCSLAKAAWGLGITNIILFFITALLAATVYRNNEEEDQMVEKVYTTRAADPYAQRHSRRHRHRHRSPRTGEYIVEERI
ncbi:hypothetical protein B9Z19DRAFT_969928 [Tuber borchii]|uniref:MARVEL domain-containing protein n=1 Tax=Tuber borchii TaxID=42251 RepID=A0A2T7A2H1_TUBBO|nr:hypothetical protein B9Z19DRAFT_969928 [Tuber borchii]